MSQQDGDHPMGEPTQDALGSVGGARALDPGDARSPRSRFK